MEGVTICGIANWSTRFADCFNCGSQWLDPCDEQHSCIHQNLQTAGRGLECVICSLKTESKTHKGTEYTVFQKTIPDSFCLQPHDQIATISEKDSVWDWFGRGNA